MRKRIVLVTGASRGIGRSIALSLANHRVIMAVHYRSQRGAAEEVVYEVERLGGEAFTLQADMSDRAGIDTMFRELDQALRKKTGEAKLDVLINNAAIASTAESEETAGDSFDHLFEVNVQGPFLVIKKALPRLRDFGRIINISSGVNRQTYPDFAAYIATKGAVNTLTTLLASHLSPRGITVNAVAHGPLEDKHDEPWLQTADEGDAAAIRSALGELGKPKQVAALVAFLASPEGGWVTGQCIEAGDRHSL